MKLKRIIAVLLCICMAVTLAQSIFADAPPDGFATWDDYYNYLIFGESSTEGVPEIHDMKLVGSNDRLAMYYHENGADIYLEDLSNGKVWGTAVDKDYIAADNLSANVTGNLMTVAYADSDNNKSETDITGASTDNASVEASYDTNCVKLKITLKNAEISYEIRFSLTNDGMEMIIPENSIKEKGDYKLLSIKALPMFGAAKPGEEGYIFYPDGSGALMNISSVKPAEAQFYTYGVYGDDSADFGILDSNASQDIKGLLLPVYGIKHTAGGIFAEITEGDGNAVLHMSAETLYQSYFELIYRTYNTVSYSFASKEATLINKVGQKRMSGDRKISYHVLSAGANTYSDMAVIYRKALESRGVLTKQDTKLSLSVELFMGISKSGMIGKSIQVLTDFSQAESIVEDLYSSGVNNLDVLLKGWCEGGYTALPSVAGAESKLGGNSGLKSLASKVKKNNGNLYRMINLIDADSETGSFNAQKYALRDGMDTIITDVPDETRYLLNPVLYMNDALKSFLKNDATGYCFDKVGTVLLSDVGKSHETTRGQIISAEKKAMKKAGEKAKVAVMGGNSYVWSSADRLYEVPDTDSKYYQTDRSIPFYQMVVHGYENYSSLAANLSYDYNYQKLRFVETGSIPHFVITEKSPNMLQGTGFNQLFSSEYSAWKDKMLAMYEEMQERLSGVWNLTIDRHSYLTDNLVCITYSDGSSAYINYASQDTEYNGIAIPAMDYVLVKGEKQ